MNKPIKSLIKIENYEFFIVYNEDETDLIEDIFISTPKSKISLFYDLSNHYVLSHITLGKTLNTQSLDTLDGKNLNDNSIYTRIGLHIISKDENGEEKLDIVFFIFKTEENAKEFYNTIMHVLGSILMQLDEDETD